MANGQYTEQEIERMREILLQHDANAPKQNEFDLNNPPRRAYVHQEFPRMVYNHETRQHRLVHNAEQLEAALKAGWRKDGYPPDGTVSEPDLDPATVAEVAEIDAKLAEGRKKAKKQPKE